MGGNEKWEGDRKVAIKCQNGSYHRKNRTAPGTERFLRGTERFLRGTERFLRGAERFLHGTERFLRGAERFLCGTERFLHGAERFLPHRYLFIAVIESVRYRFLSPPAPAMNRGEHGS